MIIDAHVHIAGVNRAKYGNFISDSLQKSMLFKLFSKHLNINEPLDDENFDDIIATKVVQLLDESVVDKALFLAMDGVYDGDGEFNKEKTEMICSNDYIYELTKKSKKVLFGASVHPYREDALEELERCKNRGAVVIKWIPSTLEIDPLNPKCIPFYRYLAQHNIMLLSHTGVEHALRNTHNHLNHPHRLKLALEQGVKVIASHSGAHMFLHERSHYKAWREMALKYDNFYGDISAFCMPTRVKHLRDISRTPALHSKLFYGSDFPVYPLPISFIFKIGFKQYRAIKKIKNPFDKAYYCMEKSEIPKEIFSQFSQHIRRTHA
jgi:predicted TIM-barrel fold metal-dependent hydrolase